MSRLLLAVVFALVAALPLPAVAQTQTTEVRATCVDALGVPHPAAQTFGERETPAAFEGELFRCLAGTHMRYDVDHRVHECAAGEALWFGAGVLSCRRAVDHPREHDRTLLRELGAGVKLAPLAVDAPPAPETRRWTYGRP